MREGPRGAGRDMIARRSAVISVRSKGPSYNPETQSNRVKYEALEVTIVFMLQQKWCVHQDDDSIPSY